MTDTIFELHKGEDGERLNLEKTFDWIINDMKYEDFKALAVLRFEQEMPNYPFRYCYRVAEEHDSPEARKDYLKYLAYKLIQNLETPSVKLEGREEI